MPTADPNANTTAARVERALAPHGVVALILLLCGLFFAFDYIRPYGSTEWMMNGLGVVDPVGAVPLLEDLFDRRMNKLVADRSSMLGNLKWQAILLAFTVAVFWHYDRSISVPVPAPRADHPSAAPPIQLFGILVPRAMLPWIKLTLPIATFYIWHQFGYLLVGLIENRRVLSEIIRLREAGVIDTASVLSSRHLLSDGFFILDPWFAAFESESLAAVAPSADVFIPPWVQVLGYGVFLGSVHAAILIPASMAITDAGSGIWLRRAAQAYLTLLTALLLATHLEFRFAYQNPNWCQPIILLTAAAMCSIAGRQLANRRKGPVLPDTE